MRTRTDVFFDNSPVFRLAEGAAAAGGMRTSPRSTDRRRSGSGWAWGRNAGWRVIAIEARIGRGRVVLYGPEILQRAHRTVEVLVQCDLLRLRDAGALHFDAG
jgi:hypothetical protein